MNKLIIFTLHGCIHCEQFKQKLKSESISFTEFDVDLHQELWNEVVEQTGNELLPAFFIKKEYTDMGPVFCPEKDFKNDDEAISIIKRYSISG